MTNKKEEQDIMKQLGFLLAAVCACASIGCKSSAPTQALAECEIETQQVGDSLGLYMCVPVDNGPFVDSTTNTITGGYLIMLCPNGSIATLITSLDRDLSKFENTKELDKVSRIVAQGSCVDSQLGGKTFTYQFRSTTVLGVEKQNKRVVD